MFGFEESGLRKAEFIIEGKIRLRMVCLQI